MDLQSDERPSALEIRTFFPWNNLDESLPVSPGLTIVLRRYREVLCAVAALPHGISEAIVYAGFVAVFLELVEFEYNLHGRVGKRHIVEVDIF